MARYIIKDGDYWLEELNQLSSDYYSAQTYTDFDKAVARAKTVDGQVYVVPEPVLIASLSTTTTTFNHGNPTSMTTSTAMPQAEEIGAPVASTTTSTTSKSTSTTTIQPASSTTTGATTV